MAENTVNMAGVFPNLTILKNNKLVLVIQHELDAL